MDRFTRLVSLASLVLAASPQHTFAATKKCTAGQACWPSADTWATFNASIGGRLVAPVPPAAVCHNDRGLYDAAACEVAKANWTNSFWRASQVGAYEDLVWENGRQECYIDAPQDAPCQQGLVPSLATAAQSSADIQASVKIPGMISSFSIWTHNLRGIAFNNSFTPAGCPASGSSPGITIQPGEHWIDVYKAADEQGVIVVGGAARSVGAAGGWVLGGGHSALGPLYGMGVDNVLQFTVVTADGEERTANACSEQDLFWALRGGGGSAFGQRRHWRHHLEWSYHPRHKLHHDQSRQTLANSEQGGWSGYLSAPPSGQGDPGALFIQANSPFGAEVAAGNYTGVNATFASLFNAGSNISTTYYAFPTYYSFVDNVITDIAIGVNSITGGRLLDEDALTKKAATLVTLSTVDPAGGSIFHMVAGGAVSKFAPDSVSLHPYWRKAIVSFNFGLSWGTNTTSIIKEALRKSLTTKIQVLAHLIDDDAASYTNEADSQEPQWRKAFWGSHYPRLLEIKKKVDPNNVFTCNRCVGSEL
ncbi:FAD/FMN-containing protein [Auriculariales sp. MPI-PUGE-AT-0066]|nr:FAD/FMN-containing protein [Auriculariales sp. MPI-PUGE-AT-0066]